MIVRTAQESDLTELLRLVALMHDTEGPAEPTEAQLQAFDQIMNDEHRRLLVAEVAGQVVGTCDLAIVPNISRGGASWCALENMVVDPSARRQGIGRSLMMEALKTAQSFGCYKLQLISAASRTPSHKLYRSVGMDVPVVGFRKYLLDVPHAASETSARD